MKKLIKLFLKAVSKMGKSKKDKGASNGQDSTFYFAGKKKPEEDEDDQEEDDEDELQVNNFRIFGKLHKTSYDLRHFNEF